MGETSVLERLIFRPEHSPKKCRILRRQSSSNAVGSAKIAASSAYSEQRRFP
jgi:hypothetical protein